jgi:serine/threonine protein kinase
LCPQFVAVKEILPQDEKDRGTVARNWVNEAKALAKVNSLSQNHIVRFITAFCRYHKDQKEYYLMFEWADGGNLRNLWNTMPRPNRQLSIVKAAIEQLLGLAEALRACHYLDSKGSNYLHGDLKPENILWYQDTIGIGNLKIGDLGIAKGHNLVTEDRPYKTITPYGTRRYEAPEVLTGLKIKYEGQSIDRRSRLYDIWAMGCITLEFIIWLLYGLEGLDMFNESIDGPFEGNTPFYEEKQELGGKLATVHAKVVEWMDLMAEDPICQKYTTALGDLLDLVRTGLLVVRLPRKMGSNLGMDIDEPSESIEFKQINSEPTDNAPAHTARLQNVNHIPGSFRSWNSSTYGHTYSRTHPCPAWTRTCRGLSLSCRSVL